MFRTTSKRVSPIRGGRGEVRELCLKAGLTAAIAALFLAAGSLVLQERHVAQAASLPGPAQQEVAALPDAVACDFVSTPFSSVFGPFGFNSPFFNQGFFNQGFFNQGFFNQGFFNPGFVNTSFIGDFPPICVSDCNGSIPAVLIPNICSAPAGAITPISTLNSISCGSNENLTFKVTSTLGLTAVDGTTVGFTASLARVTPTANTTNGQVTVSVQIPPKVSGLDTITATTGGVSTQYTLVVTC